MRDDVATRRTLVVRRDGLRHDGSRCDVFLHEGLRRHGLRRERARIRVRVVALCSGALLVGCQLAPEHVRPEWPAPAAYPDWGEERKNGGESATAETAAGADTARAYSIRWRDFITDARLETLIETALAGNRDLAEAVGQIEEARGRYRIQRADRVPAAELNADAARSRVVAGGAVGGFPSAQGGTLESRSAAIAIPAFELDFWGRVRNLSEVARGELLATAAAARAVRLALIREVADTYLAVLEAEQRISLAEATLESRRQEVALAERRFGAGVISQLEVAQAETLMTQAETELAALRFDRARGENALAVLVGGPLPTPLPAPNPLGQQASSAPLVAGLPSELLAARPDIVAAEERLRAARANIGAARAAFFPSISLTGSAGYQSTELGDLFSQDGRTWTFGPRLNLPLFDFGRRRAGVSVAEAREHIAVVQYERAIQTAFREVADALAGRRFLAEQADAQRRSTQAQRRLAELARQRYEEGVISYLEVLDAERNLFAAEQALLQVQRAEAANLIALYVALGGGAWEDLRR